jgi:hypothetical protein
MGSRLTSAILTKHSQPTGSEKAATAATDNEGERNSNRTSSLKHVIISSGAVYSRNSHSVFSKLHINKKI